MWKQCAHMYFVNNCFPTECTGSNPAMPNRMPRISLSDEHRLRQELFSQTNKDRMVRPVLNSSESIKVKFVVQLNSVVDVVSSILSSNRSYTHIISHSMKVFRIIYLYD